ncbi:hypothetical protein YC2023_087825 [Brassica napus]
MSISMRIIASHTSNLSRAMLTSGFKNEEKRRTRISLRREIREETRSAQGTSRVREKPRVDTINVKGVAAFRQKPELVLCFELTETHGAIKGVVLETNDELVVENR